MTHPIYKPKRLAPGKALPRHTLRANGDIETNPTWNEMRARASLLIYVRVLVPCFVHGDPRQEGDRVRVNLREYLARRGKGVYARAGVDMGGYILFTEQPATVSNQAAQAAIEGKPVILYQGSGEANIAAPQMLRSADDYFAAISQMRSEAEAKRILLMKATQRIRNAEPGSQEEKDAVEVVKSLRVEIARLSDCGCARRRAMREAQRKAEEMARQEAVTIGGDEEPR